MPVMLWISFGIVMVVGAVALLLIASALTYWILGEWWPSKLRSRQDAANQAQMERIRAALYRVGRTGCEAYSIEQLCWFCSQHGIKLRNTEHGEMYTQEQSDD